ncbi:hypothetical protein [Brevundimonas sp. TWP3-1-2b1]|uniref:hypothetical protein n=1 Tax=Brevundimonas sp. TWP3-1-2b1 TaxID=2804650 RepID=UPI003CF40D4F
MLINETPAVRGHGGRSVSVQLGGIEQREDKPKTPQATSRLFHPRTHAEAVSSAHEFSAAARRCAAAVSDCPGTAGLALAALAGRYAAQARHFTALVMTLPEVAS